MNGRGVWYRPNARRGSGALPAARADRLTGGPLKEI
jgi:hypothetical protein